jgi:hypothetical protein
MLHIYSSRLRASVQETWQGDAMLGGRCSAAPRILGRRARWSLARARDRTKEWRRPCLWRWGILWLNSRPDLLGNCVQRDCPASKQVLKGEIYQNERFGLRRLTVQGGKKMREQMYTVDKESHNMASTFPQRGRFAYYNSKCGERRTASEQSPYPVDGMCKPETLCLASNTWRHSGITHCVFCCWCTQKC